MADSSEFEHYVHAHGTGLARLARLLTGDPYRAEDLVQDVLARAYPRWGRIARADHPELYLRRMMVNLNTSWWRRRSSHEVQVPQPADVADERDMGAEAALRVALWREVAALPSRQRAVVALRYYEDLGDAQIAEVLGCSEATVRTHAMRGLAAMRDRLGSLPALAYADDPVDTATLAAQAVRSGRRRQWTARSAVAAAIAALTGAAITVPVLVWGSGPVNAPTFPKPSHLHHSVAPDPRPVVRTAYVPPASGGVTAAEEPDILGTDPFTLHFLFGSLPRPARESRWWVAGGVESASFSFSGVGGLTLRLVPGAGPEAFPLPGPTAPDQPSVTGSRAVKVGTLPGLLSTLDAPGTPAMVRLSWAPVEGAAAQLDARGIPEPELLALAADVRLVNSRCSLPAAFTGVPANLTPTTCSFAYSGPMGQTNIDVELHDGDRGGAYFTVNVPDGSVGDPHEPGLVPGKLPGWRYRYPGAPGPYYNGSAEAFGPSEIISIATRGSIVQADAERLLDGMRPVPDAHNRDSWPAHPFG